MKILKDIGVTSAGHRLRIRHAISKLNPVVPLAIKPTALPSDRSIVMAGLDPAIQ